MVDGLDGPVIIPMHTSVKKVNLYGHFGLQCFVILPMSIISSVFLCVYIHIHLYLSSSFDITTTIISASPSKTCSECKTVITTSAAIPMTAAAVDAVTSPSLDELQPTSNDLLTTGYSSIHSEREKGKNNHE